MKPWFDLPMNSSNMPVFSGDLKPLRDMNTLLSTIAVGLVAGSTCDEMADLAKEVSGVSKPEDEEHRLDELYWSVRDEQNAEEDEL